MINNADEARLQFNEIVSIICKQDYKDSLKQLALKGNLESRQRILVWLICLELFDSDVTNWPKALEEQRENYLNLCEKFSCQKAEHPLEALEWDQAISDEELKKTIAQDVERTFPDYNFFRSERIQKTMHELLFVYSKVHNDIQYRQGMHEILAVILFVVEESCLSLDDVEAKEWWFAIFDSSDVDCKAYCIFDRIMLVLKQFYVYSDPSASNSPKKSFVFDETQLFQTKSTNVTESPLNRRLQHLHKILLRKIDYRLYKHLKTLGIEPQIYGIRWYRLLFGREFTLDQVMTLWDIIITDDGASFNIMDWIAVSMLLENKENLLSSEFHVALKCLMKYPSDFNPSDIAKKSFSLREKYGSSHSLAKEPPYPQESISSSATSVTSPNNQARVKSPVVIFNDLKKSIMSFGAGQKQSKHTNHESFSQMSSESASELQERLKGEIFHTRTIQSSVQSGIRLLQEVEVQMKTDVKSTTTKNSPATFPTNSETIEDLNPWSAGLKADDNLDSTQDNTLPTISALFPSIGSNLAEMKKKEIMDKLHEADQQLENLIIRLEDLSEYFSIYEKNIKTQVTISDPERNEIINTDENSSATATKQNKISLKDIITEVENFALPVGATVTSQSKSSVLFTESTTSGTRGLRSKQLEDLLK